MLYGLRAASRPSRILLLLPALLFGAFQAAVSAQDDLPPVPRVATRAPDGVLVAFRPQVALDRRLETLNRLSLTVDSRRAGRHAARRKISPTGRGAGMTLQAALLALRRDPAVRIAQPDYLRRAAVVPNDPQFTSQWALENSGQSGGTLDADVDAPQAWDTTAGSDQVIVAVIDSGVDYNHPDLQQNILRNGSGAVVGYDYANGDSDPMDDESHGTHVAGIVGARGDNGVGVAGISQRVKIMPLKFLDRDGVGYDSDAIESIDFAIANGADIINASWGSPDPSPLLLEAIQRARDAGVLFVTAAGNGGEDGIGDDNDVTPDYPANYNAQSGNVVSVAATTRRDALASFSNYGDTTVDIAAPGDAILSTVPGGGYESWSGTSMATPCVAGAAALALAADSSLSVTALKAALLGSVDTPAALNGRTRSGRLNAGRLVVPGTPTYSIRGTVSLDGSALSGVTVTAGSESAVTGADGRYALAGLAAGTYAVQPARSGYTFTPASRTATVAPDQSGVDFSAAAVPAQEYTISGTVTANGAGLAGALVTAGVRSATTGSDGTYRISALPAGTYTLRPIRSGYTFTPASRTVTLRSDTPGVNFASTAPPAAQYAISGKVTLDGAGLGGVLITVGSRSTTTASNGVYRIAALAAGTYTVGAGRTGYTLSPGSRQVALGPDAAAVDFAASRNESRISGTVRMNGLGVRGVRITAGSAAATTNASGAYTLTVPSGTYTVRASLAGYRFRPASQSVSATSDRSGIDFDLLGPALASLTLNVPSIKSRRSAAGTVRLSGPAPAELFVSLSSSDTSAAQVPGGATVPSGASTATFSVTTTRVRRARTVTLTAGYNGVSRTATLKVKR
jgi:subtilisin family serine protease